MTIVASMINANSNTNDLGADFKQFFDNQVVPLVKTSVNLAAESGIPVSDQGFFIERVCHVFKDELASFLTGYDPQMMLAFSQKITAVAKEQMGFIDTEFESLVA